MTLKIDNEFKNLIPPLKTEELERLEKSILTEGIRDALIVWGDVLIDGHNRYAIANKHGLSYKTKALEFDGREDVVLWIINNQLGRRNLTPQQMSYLIGKRYEVEKKKKGGTGANQYTEQIDQNDPSATADRISDETGVSAPTVRRDAKYSQAIDIIAETLGDDAKDAILTAEVRLSKKDTLALADLAPKEPEVVKQIVITDKKSVAQAKRELTRRKQLDRVSELEEQAKAQNIQEKYRVVYADPPWQYNDSGIINDSDNYGRAERHYPTLSIETLCAMGDAIKEISAKDAVLFLWVTSPFLEDCFQVINAWGFKYKTSFVWDKIGHNFGHYNSVRHEFLLVCTRGNCTPDALKLFDSVQSIQKSKKHSEKPEEFREIIETLYTHGKRVELFARKETEGWDVWGNEV